ncbi:MAG TPA: hypothetical protein VF456_20620 [Vicinamibacterales bacterium]
MKRLVRASLIAPLTAPVLYYAMAIGAALLDPLRRASVSQSLLNSLVLVIAFGAPIAYVATLGIGLPLLWIVRRVAPLTLARTILVGFLVGVAVASGLAPWLRGELVSIPLPPWQGALLGGAAAAVWYQLAFG